MDILMSKKTFPFLLVSYFVLLSFPALAENTPLSPDEIGEYLMRTLLIETLEEKQQSFYRKVLEKIQNNLEEKELIDASDPLYIDFQKAVDELNNFIDERHKTIKAKEESINRRVRAFNAKVDRYTEAYSTI